MLRDGIATTDEQEDEEMRTLGFRMCEETNSQTGEFIISRYCHTQDIIIITY